MRAIALFVLLWVCSPSLYRSADAAIVLTAIQTSPLTSNDVTVNLYGTWDGVNSPGLDALKSQQVAAYHFRITLTGGTVSGLTSSFAAGSTWNAIATAGAPVVNAGAQTITFEGANTAGVFQPVTNATIGTTLGASTLLATFAFNAPIGSYTTTFSMLNSTIYPTLNGFAFVGANSGLPQDQGQQSVFAPPVVLQVNAIPEPSTLALCGLACLGWGYRRRWQRARV